MKIAMIDVCSACTAKCKYCLHQYRNFVKGRMMDAEKFIDLIDILSFEGYDYIYPYLSGEPMLNKNYWSMVSYMSYKGITSNTASKLCFKIDFAEAEQVINNLINPIHFDITIDADCQEVQDNISRGIDNNQVFENLKRLYEISYGKKVTFSVVTVKNKFNENRLEKISKRISECGKFKWAVKQMGYYMGYRMTPEDMAMISEMSCSDNQRFSIGSDGTIKSNMKQCSSFLKPVIGPDGEVTICCHDMLYKESRWNVFDTGSLDKIVNSAEYQALVEKGKRMELEICEGCN